MLLVHDIGEIDTGDTIAFAVGGWEERKAAELAAVKRIAGMLPEAQSGRRRTTRASPMRSTARCPCC